MKQELKLQLEALIDSIVEGNDEAATTALSQYLRPKTRDLLLGEAEDADEDKEDDKEDKKDEKSEDKSDDKKDDDKEDKKSKKDKKDEEDCEM